MYPQKKQATGEPSSPVNVTNDEDDALLTRASIHSCPTPYGRKYDVQVPMSRALAAILPTPQLNDDCCLALFNQFTLNRKLQLRAVCRQWQTIIEHKCRRMRSLKIFRDIEGVREYCRHLVELNQHQDDQLKLKPIGIGDDLIVRLDQLQRFSHLFSDITTFVCYDQYSNPNLHLIPVMFSNLTTLTLYTASSPFPILHSLPKLTSLHLHYLAEDTAIPEDSPILRQLESFSLCHYYGPNTVSLLIQLGPQLTRLMLCGVSLTEPQLTTALTENPFLTTSVTHLQLENDSGFLEGYPPLLDLICNHMTSLIYLHFFYINLESLSFLVKLPHLTELHIHRLELPQVLPRHLPQVKSIKQLYVTFLHIPTVALNLQSLFPTVETINIKDSWNYSLHRAREYMAQFDHSITCQVAYHEKDYQIILYSRYLDIFYSFRNLRLPHALFRRNRFHL